MTGSAHANNDAETLFLVEVRFRLRHLAFRVEQNGNRSKLTSLYTGISRFSLAIGSPRTGSPGLSWKRGEVAIVAAGAAIDRRRNMSLSFRADEVRLLLDPDGDTSGGMEMASSRACGTNCACTETM